MTNEQLYNKIQEKHGVEAMRNVWIEELLELALILQQDTRPDKLIKFGLIHKEIADVEICLEQMKYCRFNPKYVEEFKQEVLMNLPRKLQL